MSYGRIPYWVVEGGHWATMTNSERAIFGAVCAHIKGRNNGSYPNQTTIARESGTSLSTISRVTEELERRGLWEVKRGKGRGNSTEYTVSYTKPITMDEGFSRARKPVKSGHKTCQTAAENPSNLAIKPVTIDDCPIEGKEGREGIYTKAGKPPKQRGKPNPIWDTLVELFHISSPGKSERTRLGRVVADLKSKNAAPEEIRIVYKRCQTEWDGKPFSPEALVKWFDQYRVGLNGGGRQDNPARIHASRGKYEGASERW